MRDAFWRRWCLARLRVFQWLAHWLIEAAGGCNWLAAQALGDWADLDGPLACHDADGNEASPILSRSARSEAFNRALGFHP